jgi:hypothetical protein
MFASWTDSHDHVEKMRRDRTRKADGDADNKGNEKEEGCLNDLPGVEIRERRAAGWPSRSFSGARP